VADLCLSRYISRHRYHAVVLAPLFSVHRTLLLLLFFFLLLRPPPRSTLFPYTTLFRSQRLLLLRIIAQDNTGSDFDRTGRCRNRSEEHTSELQSPDHLVCRLLLEKKKTLDLGDVVSYVGAQPQVRLPEW